MSSVVLLPKRLMAQDGPMGVLQVMGVDWYRVMPEGVLVAPRKAVEALRLEATFTPYVPPDGATLVLVEPSSKRYSTERGFHVA